METPLPIQQEVATTVSSASKEPKQRTCCIYHAISTMVRLLLTWARIGASSRDDHAIVNANLIRNQLVEVTVDIEIQTTSDHVAAGDECLSSTNDDGDRRWKGKPTTYLHNWPILYRNSAYSTPLNDIFRRLLDSRQSKLSGLCHSEATTVVSLTR